MITIPLINYITYTLPLIFPPLLLKRFNKAVDTILWAGKRALFNRTKILAAKEDGGPSLLKLDWYHYAFSLIQLSKMYLLGDKAPGWFTKRKLPLISKSDRRTISRQQVS